MPDMRVSNHLLRIVDYLVCVLLFILVAATTWPSALSTEWALHQMGFGQDVTHYLALGRSLRFGEGYTAFGRGEGDDTWMPEIYSQEVLGIRPVKLYAADEWARESALGKYQPELIRTPGYPLFVSAVAAPSPRVSEIQRISLIQSIVAGLAVVLLYGFLRSEKIERPWAIVTAVLFATSTTYLHISQSIGPDCLVVVLTLALNVALFKCANRRVSFGHVLLAALAMVLLTTLRAEAYSFSSAVVILYILLGNRLPFWNRLRTSLIVISLGSVFCIGWGIRNYHEFGSFGQAIHADWHMAWQVAPTVVQEALGTDFPTASLLVADHIDEHLAAFETITGRMPTGLERSRIFGQAARAVMYKYWVTTISVVSKTSLVKILNPDFLGLHQLLGNLSYSGGSGVLEGLSTGDLPQLFEAISNLIRAGSLGVLDICVALLHMTRLSLAMLGTRIILMRRQWNYLAALLLQIGFFGVASLSNNMPRHFLPALPAICILIGLSNPHIRLRREAGN